MGVFPSGQRGQTVNLLSADYGGSNPPAPTKKDEIEGSRLFSYHFVRLPNSVKGDLMRIVVLMENNAGNAGILAEHGLSIYVETSRHHLLVDAGPSADTWQNAAQLNIDISAIDTLVLSHGHYDHSGGIMDFAYKNSTAKIYMQKTAGGDFYNGERYIGIDKRILALPQTVLVEGDLVIDGELSLHTNITGRRLWPRSNLKLTEKVNGSFIQDSFIHEQFLVIRDNGISVLISGCAHNGILNILDRYSAVYQAEPDIVISGFHMMKNDEYTPDEEKDIRETAKILSTMKTQFYTGHCTGIPAFEIMKPLMPANLHQMHSGDEIYRA